MISGTREPFRFGEGFEDACEYRQGRHEYDGRADPTGSVINHRLMPYAAPSNTGAAMKAYNQPFLFDDI